jgi:hypothetical protein
MNKNFNAHMLPPFKLAQNAKKPQGFAVWQEGGGNLRDKSHDSEGLRLFNDAPRTVKNYILTQFTAIASIFQNRISPGEIVPAYSGFDSLVRHNRSDICDSKT